MFNKQWLWEKLKGCNEVSALVVTKNGDSPTGSKVAILYIIYSVYIILCIHMHIIYMIYIVYIYIERLGGKYITCREGQGMAEWVNKEGENNKK